MRLCVSVVESFGGCRDNRTLTRGGGWDGFGLGDGRAAGAAEVGIPRRSLRTTLVVWVSEVRGRLVPLMFVDGGAVTGVTFPLTRA